MDAAQPALVSHQTNLDQDHARAQGATFVDKPSLAPSCPPPSPLDAYLLPGTTTFSRDRNGRVKGHICASLVRRLKRHSSRLGTTSNLRRHGGGSASHSQVMSQTSCKLPPHAIGLRLSPPGTSRARDSRHAPTPAAQRIGQLRYASATSWMRQLKTRPRGPVPSGHQVAWHLACL